MAASLADAILFAQLILLLLPVVAALLQMVIRTHYDNDVDISSNIAFLGVMALVLVAMFLSFAAWDVTGYILENVENPRLESAVDNIRWAIAILGIFIYIFFLAIGPVYDTSDFKGISGRLPNWITTKPNTDETGDVESP